MKNLRLIKMKKYKYAILKKDLIKICNNSRHYPVQEDLIEIESLTRDKLKGYLVEHKLFFEGKPTEEEYEEIAENDIIEYVNIFGKKKKKLNCIWAELKKRTPIEIDLRNFKVVKLDEVSND